MGDRFRGYGDLHLQAPKYFGAIYCDTTCNRPFTRDVVEAGIAGTNEVLGAGGTAFSRPAGGG